MDELVYTDEQLDAMSQEELKTEYERVTHWMPLPARPEVQE